MYGLRRRLIGAATNEAKDQIGVKLLPLPMFGRIFIALIALTIAAAAMIGATFGAYQERVTAMTLAPMWAAAIKSAQEQPTDSQPEPLRRELELNMRVERVGPGRRLRRHIRSHRTAAPSRWSTRWREAGISITDTLASTTRRNCRSRGCR